MLYSSTLSPPFPPKIYLEAIENKAVMLVYQKSSGFVLIQLDIPGC